MNLFPLYEGSFSVDSTKKFVPFREGVDDPKTRPGSIFIHVQPFLVETSHDLILLDSGIGHRNAMGEPQIWDNIRANGFLPKEVTKVILSHLHSDHSLGLVRGREEEEMQLNFPNALHYIQREEMESALDPENSSYPHKILNFVKGQAKIKYIEGNEVLENGIEFQLTGGHSPYHQVILLSDRYDFFFFGGDILPEGIQLVRNYIAKYDFDGRKSMELRRKYGKEAAEENWTCLYYHDNNPKPYSKVRLSQDGGFILEYPQ